MHYHELRSSKPVVSAAVGSRVMTSVPKECIAAVRCALTRWRDRRASVRTVLAVATDLSSVVWLAGYCGLWRVPLSESERMRHGTEATLRVCYRSTTTTAKRAHELADNCYQPQLDALAVEDVWN
eukprot:1683350-Pleurochrysis_carterae.AAC.2